MDKFPPRIGEVILRPVTLVPKPGKGHLVYDKAPADILFQKSTNGEHMVWARRKPDVDNLWVATQDGKGMVCFIDGDVPEDYTHFTIFRVGRYGKNVHVKPSAWPTQQLLDLFTTPNEERSAHELLVQRVADLLSKQPDLLPVGSLVKGMTERQIVALVKQWIDTHRQGSPKEDRNAVASAIGSAIGKLDA